MQRGRGLLLSRVIDLDIHVESFFSSLDDVDLLYLR